MNGKKVTERQILFTRTVLQNKKRQKKELISIQKKKFCVRK